MKIKFDKLETSNESIKVSFNGGASYKNFGVESIRKRGIILDDSQNYGKIRIVGKSTVLKNLDVVKDISIPNKTFFLVNTYNGGRWDVKSVRNLVKTPMAEAELSFDEDGEAYEDYSSTEADLPAIDASGIMVSILWLQDVFGIENFDAECLVNEWGDLYRPFGYLQNGQPLLYVFDIYNHSPIVYNDGTTQKYFYPSLIESENVAKDLPTFKILLEDETVLEEKTIYVNYIRDKLYPIINDRPDDFSGYDWDVFKNVWEDYDEETDSYTESFQHYFRIEDQQVNVWDSLWLDNDLTLRICNKQEHVYHYNARYVDDQSKFSISFTKNNPQLPDTPTKPFATFLGWYQDSGFNKPLNLGDIDSDSYIYAKWEYLDATRTVYFMYKNQRFEMDFTKKSNQTENISNVLSQLKYKYTGFSTLSSNYNYQVPFNSDEDLDITQYVSNISVKSFTNTFRVWTSSSSAVDFTESFNYYEPSIELEPIVDKIYNGYLQKGAFENYVFEDSYTNTSLDIDSLNALRRKNENTFIHVRTKNVESVKIIYDNFNDNNKAIELGLPATLKDTTINFGYGYPEYCPLYVSLETINENNNGKQYFTYYGSRTVNLDGLNSRFKSPDTLDTIHFCFKFGDSLYPKISLYVENYGIPKNSVQYNENILLPKNFNELLSFTGLDTKNFTKDDVEPEEGTYSMSYTIGNDHYLPGETASFPMISVLDNNEYKVNMAYEIKIKFFAIPINYNSTAKVKSKDFFGEDKELETNVVLKQNDSYNTDVITDLDIEYSIDSLDNCTFNKLNNKEVYLCKTYLDKSINVTFLDNSLRNCFGGIGDTSTEENINKVLSQPEVYIYNNLKIEGTVLSNVLNLINNGTSINLSTKNKSLNEGNIGFVLQNDKTAFKSVLLVSNDVSRDIITDETKTKVSLATNLKNFIKYNNTYYDTEYNVIQVSTDSIIKSRDFAKLNIPTLLQSVSRYFEQPLICCGSSFVTYNLEAYSSNNYYNQDFNYEINGFYIGGFNNKAIKVYPSGKLEINTTSTTSTNGLTHLTDINNGYRWGAYIGQYNNRWAVWWPVKDINSSDFYGSGYYITSDTTFNYVSGKLTNLGSYFSWTTKRASPPGASEYFNYNSLGIYVSKGNPVTYKDVPDELKDVNVTVGIYVDNVESSNTDNNLGQ